MTGLSGELGNDFNESYVITKDTENGLACANVGSSGVEMATTVLGFLRLGGFPEYGMPNDFCQDWTINLIAVFKKNKSFEKKIGVCHGYAKRRHS